MCEENGESKYNEISLNYLKRVTPKFKFVIFKFKFYQILRVRVGDCCCAYIMNVQRVSNDYLDDLGRVVVLLMVRWSVQSIYFS